MIGPCGKCEFWSPAEVTYAGPLGLCRFHAPVPMSVRSDTPPAETKQRFKTVWPVTSKGDSCGQYQPKNQSTK